MFGVQKPTNVFRQTLTLGDATSTGDGKTTDTSTWVEVWKLRVPAQQQKTLGWGGIVGGVDDRGVLYINLKDNSGTPVQIEGKIRLEIRNANETVSKVVLEERTERLRGSKTDLSQAYRLGEAPIRAREDSYLVVTIKADAAKTIENDNSDLAIPVTTYTL